MTRLRKLKWSRNAFDGVVIDPETLELDEEETRKLRSGTGV